MPPGLDVVCFSNGRDYVRGMRHAVYQARAGRVIMSVDSTNLLNQRHLDVGQRDSLWMREFPSEASGMLPFDSVIFYDEGDDSDGVEIASSGALDTTEIDMLLVSYGNGIPTSILARRQLKDMDAFKDKRVAVVDCPLLSATPQALEHLLEKSNAVVFADVCKEGQHPFAGFISRAQSSGVLPTKWRCAAAQPTFNPLGRTLTFLSEGDVIEACQALA